jgi:hypothetical protein
LKSIKKHYNKEGHQVVSVSEFSDYMGLKEEEVENCIV